MTEQEIIQGDSLEVLAKMDEASVDAVVTDPPYGLEFMGVDWDTMREDGKPRTRNEWGDFGSREHARQASEVAHVRRKKGIAFQKFSEAWAHEVLRVMKPGAHLLAFGGSRTYHRMACAVEDAGFEIRDQIMWLYGQGFPKSLDVSKAIDKAAGAERQVVGYDASRARPNRKYEGGAIGNIGGTGKPSDRTDNGATITAAATPAACLWAGWGTALKPAHEPIVVARKPLEGPVAANVLRHGTGALNIDGCRIEGPKGSGVWGTSNAECQDGRTFNASPDGEAYKSAPHLAGRWPANVVLSHDDRCVEAGEQTVRRDLRQSHSTDTPGKNTYGSGGPGGGSESLGSTTEAQAVWACVPNCPVRALDEQSGKLTSGTGAVKRAAARGYSPLVFGAESREAGTPNIEYGDSGFASRFFYTAKASGSDRGNRVVPEAPLFGLAEEEFRNTHPTVKPVDLMRWLVRLVTPPGGLVLDPFAGSGTTGVACKLEGFRFVGVEREAEYVEISRRRLAQTKSGG